VPLRELPYERLEPLLRDRISTDEDPPTAELIRELRPARARGYLTKAELQAVCRWKSPRAIHRIRSNTARRIRVLTASALRTRSERRRLKALTSLRGVSVPMASAVLTLLNPRRYGVIDIRVWQLLCELGTVSKKLRGVGFDFRNWYQFLVIIRYFARKLGVHARHVERTLFHVHKEYQHGRLYEFRNGRRPSNRNTALDRTARFVRGR
jgi:hypothetical protein